MLAKISETGAGSLNVLQNKFEAISLEVGESLIPLVKQLAGAMGDLTSSSVSGRADSAIDVIGNGFAGSVALLRSILKNDWKPMNEVLDSMDAKNVASQAAAEAKPADIRSNLEQKRSAEIQKLMRIYAGKDRYASEEEFEINLAKQQDLLRWLDKQIAKEKAINQEKARRDELQRKEQDRVNQVAAFMKPMEDKLALDRFNAANKLKAESIEEMEIIKQMTAQERERLAILREQTKEKDKTKKTDNQKKLESLKSSADDIATRSMSPLEQFRSQLKQIEIMSGMSMFANRDIRDAAVSNAYDSTIGARRPELQLAPDLQMGTQGAYQALVGVQNSAQDRMLKAQEKQTEIQRESNRILAEVKTAINEMKDELKEVLPGDGG